LWADSDSRDRLNRADLVVGVHHGDDGDLRREEALKRRGSHDAVARHRRGDPLTAATREMAACVQHRLVLDRAGDKALAPAALHSFGGTPNGEVVRLGASGREDDFGWLGANKAGNAVPGLVDGRFGTLSIGMDTGGVAEG
jgi:hypothetical protein